MQDQDKEHWAERRLFEDEKEEENFSDYLDNALLDG